MTDNAVFHAIPHLKYSTGVAVTLEVVVGSSLRAPSLPSPSFSSSSSRYISPSYCPIAASLGVSHRSLLSRRQLLAFMADNTNIGVIMSLASLPPRHLLRPPLPAPKMNLLLPMSPQASGQRTLPFVGVELFLSPMDCSSSQVVPSQPARTPRPPPASPHS